MDDQTHHDPLCLFLALVFGGIYIIYTLSECHTVGPVGSLGYDECMMGFMPQKQVPDPDVYDVIKTLFDFLIK